MSDPRPLLTDVSANQGKMNVAIMAANGVLGIVPRAGISWSYKDPVFPDVWAQAGDVGIYRTSYHVLYTDQSITAQADSWYAVHPERDIVPRWIDLEVDRGDSAYTKAFNTWKMVELVEQRDGIPPTIYSRYLLVNQWLVPYWTVEQLNHVTWALAQYLFDRTSEHPGPPTLPNGVRADRVLYHQTADKIPGWPGSIESSALDRDRWCLGDEQQMHSYILNNWGGGDDSPPDDTPPPEEPQMIIRVDEHEGSKLAPVGGGWTAWSSPIVPDGEFWTIEHMYAGMTGKVVTSVGLDILALDGKYRRIHSGAGSFIQTVNVTMKPGERFRIGTSGFPEGQTFLWYFRVRVEAVA